MNKRGRIIWSLLLILLFIVLGNSQTVQETYENGNVKSMGQFDDNGLMIGRWVYYYENVNGEGNFINGDGRDGLWTFYYENGAKHSEHTYKKGVKVGIYTRWFNNGQKEVLGYFEDDKLIIKDKWAPDEFAQVVNSAGIPINRHSNGQKAYETEFVNGLFHGRTIEWFC